MRPLLLDASVAVAIARGEPGAAEAANVVAARSAAGIPLVVPSYFWLEVVNSLIRRHKWSGSSVMAAVHQLDDLQIETIEVDRALLISVIDLAERHLLSAYDAAYLTVAEAFDGDLLTFDRTLAQAAGARAVPLGGHQPADTRAPYEGAPTWPSYKGASAFLAKLRAEAARTG